MLFCKSPEKMTYLMSRYEHLFMIVIYKETQNCVFLSSELTILYHVEPEPYNRGIRYNSSHSTIISLYLCYSGHKNS